MLARKTGRPAGPSLPQRSRLSELLEGSGVIILFPQCGHKLTAALLGEIDSTCCLDQAIAVQEVITVKPAYAIKMIEVVGKQFAGAWYERMTDTGRLHRRRCF